MHPAETEQASALQAGSAGAPECVQGPGDRVLGPCARRSGRGAGVDARLMLARQAGQLPLRQARSLPVDPFLNTIGICSVEQKARRFNPELSHCEIRNPFCNAPVCGPANLGLTASCPWDRNRGLLLRSLWRERCFFRQMSEVLKQHERLA